MAVERPLTTVSLHTSRAAQVRDIAKSKGVTISELFGQWVNREIAEGVYADVTPGVGILEIPVGESPIYQLSFGMDGAHTIEVADKAMVRRVAMMLQHAAKIGSGAIEDGKVKGHGTPLDGGHHIAVMRMGRGIAIKVDSPDKSTTLTLTPDLAMDVVRQFGTAIGDFN